MLGLTIEEARRPTQLPKVSLTEGLLDDDVQEVLVHLVLLVLKLAVQVDQRLALNQNFDFESGIVINPFIEKSSSSGCITKSYCCEQM